MTLREFMRFHLLKALLVLVVIQIAIVAYIQNFNHRPVAQRDQTSMIEERKVKITPLFNDLDKDEGQELTLKNIFKPIHGTVEQKENLLFYTPEKDFTGIDSFAYTVSDGKKESKKAYIAIQVNKNLEPIASRDIADVYSGSKSTINVLGNDNDREGDSIFIKGYSQPTHGSVSIVNNNLVYTSDATSALKDSFRYCICDGKSNSDSVSVNINILSKSSFCYPWLSCDIGDFAKKGSFSGSANSFVIEASGSDIWNNNDGLRYVYQRVTGDCEISAKVESLKGNHEWAKAGVMVRESLNGGSKTVYVLISNKNGATYHHRFNTNDRMEGGDKTDIKAPYWVKLIRKGDSFNYYISANGSTWKNIGNAKVSMNNAVYIGLAVTSHDNNDIAKAVYSNFRLTGK